MSSGIENQKRDFIIGIKGQGTDWHKLTQEREAPLVPEMFPEFYETPLLTGKGIDSGRRILATTDDDLTCGEPFYQKSFGYILPSVAWKMIENALEGTDYTVERIAMLRDRSFWFISISLDELKSVSRKGEKFQLNISGGLDKKFSPQCELSNIRAVCWNTISLSRLLGELIFKLRQSANSMEKIPEATERIEKAAGMCKIFNTTLDNLDATSIDINTARRIYAADVSRNGGNFKITKTKKGEDRENRAMNTVDTLVKLFVDGDGNKGKDRGDLLNGMTQLLTRGSEDSKKNKWAVLDSSEFGPNADRKSQFMNWISDEKQFAKMRDEGEEILNSLN